MVIVKYRPFRQFYQVNGDKAGNFVNTFMGNIMVNHDLKKSGREKIGFTRDQTLFFGVSHPAANPVMGQQLL